MSIIIAGIHTGIGKTVCATIMCQALGYDYWKPLQAGDLDNSDSIFVQRNNTNPFCHIHPELYRLQTAASPHYAAAIDGIEIIKEAFVLPNSKNNIVVETAGGLMSPLATHFLNIDLIEALNLPVMLVSNNYLGSINHTLLSIEALQNRKIDVLGIVFCGPANKQSQDYILEYTKLPLLFSIPTFDKINASVIEAFSKTIPINILNK